MTNRLRYFLELEDLSPQQIAEKVGVSKSYIFLICGGRRRPSLPVALKISDVLRRPVGEIFFNLPSSE